MSGNCKCANTASMQPRLDVLEALVRYCRILRQSADVERVRAVLDVEEDLTKKLVAAGGRVPAAAAELHPGKGRRRANLIAEPKA